ncbi:hypothetical protein ACLMJK_000495 [Lecanora helva]
MPWVYDTVPQYRLARETVELFLREKFGAHEFKIEASVAAIDRRLLAHIYQRYVDEWRFLIPNALTEDEKFELLDRR